MKRSITAVLLISLALGRLDAQISYWCRNYNADPFGSGYAESATLSLSGTSIVVAARIDSAGTSYLALLEIDPDGNVLRSNLVGFGGTVGPRHIITTPDSAYVVVGGMFYGSAPPSPAPSHFVAKFDRNLNLVWYRVRRVPRSRWSCCGNYLGAHLRKVDLWNGIFIAAGRETSCACDGADAKVALYDPSGNLLRIRTFHGNSSSSYLNSGLSDIEILSDNKVLLFGGGGWPSDARLKVFAVDTLLNILWSKNVRIPSYSVGFSWGGDARTARISAGSIFVSGVAKPSSGDWDLYFMKMDTSGNGSWLKTIRTSGNEVVYDLLYYNGHVYAVGYTTTWGAGGEDGFLVKADTNGNVLWLKTYGLSGRERIYGLTVMPDGNLLLVGWANGKPWLIKVDTSGSGCSSCISGTYYPSTTSLSFTTGTGHTLTSYPATDLTTLNLRAWPLTFSSICVIGVGDTSLTVEERMCSVPDSEVEIYSTDGRLIYRGSYSGFRPKRRGVYILKSGGYMRAIVR